MGYRSPTAFTLSSGRMIVKSYYGVALVKNVATKRLLELSEISA